MTFENLSAGFTAFAAGCIEGIKNAIKGPDINREVAQEREALKKQLAAAFDQMRRIDPSRSSDTNYDGASLDDLRETLGRVKADLESSGKK